MGGYTRGPWDEFVEDIDDVISDSIDMDWTSTYGAKAVVSWLNENALAGAEIAQIRADREELLAALIGVVRIADRDTPEFRFARAAIQKAGG